MFSIAIWPFIAIALLSRTSVDATLFEWLIGRRSTTNPGVSSVPTRCFEHFFLQRQIPQQLEINFADTPPSQLKYICQTRDNIFTVYYYASLFDEKYGVPVYSGYRINQNDGRNIDRIRGGRPPSNAWQTTPGIAFQGDKDVYTGSSAEGIHKGHLNPCQINSYDRSYMFATFVYTNAVPQCGPTFNSATWRDFETKIRTYTKDVCAHNHSGTMYLVTGQSRYGIQVSSSGVISQVAGGVHYFPAHAPVKILRPNALWTAGCCVYQSSTGTRAESIAVIGNNDMLSNCNPTKSVNLTTLEWLIVDPRATPANIFPGNPDCRMNHYNLSVL